MTEPQGTKMFYFARGFQLIRVLGSSRLYRCSAQDRKDYVMRKFRSRLVSLYVLH